MFTIYFYEVISTYYHEQMYFFQQSSLQDEINFIYKQIKKLCLYYFYYSVKIARISILNSSILVSFGINGLIVRTYELLSIEGNLLEQYFEKSMRPSFNLKDDRTKLSHYQQYRNKTRTELKCNSSSLIPDLNDLDLQVKQYEQLRSKKLSQSQVQGLNLKEISNLHQSSFRVQKSQRLFSTNLQTIEEYQANRQPGRAKTNMVSSPMVPNKNQKTAQKSNFSKNMNGKTKQQALKRQKIQTLKAKAKQLQVELLSAIGNDSTKKNLINKQFSIIIKLLE